MRKHMMRGALVILLAAGIGLVVSAREKQRPAVSPGKTAVQHVLLFDGERIVRNATVVFDESGITSVCSGCEAPPDAKVIDGRGRTLLPGLIDAHTHSWGSSLERALVFGVTTEIDMFTSAEFATARRAEQKKGGAAARADLVSAGTLVTVAGGHGTEYGVPIPTFAGGTDPQKFIDDRIAEGSDFIKLVYDDGSAYGLDFKTLDKRDLTRLIAAAHARRKIAVVHTSTAAAAREAVLAGADGLVHVWSAGSADASLYDLIAARKVFVIPTLTVLASIAGQPASEFQSHPSLARFVSDEERSGLKARFPGGALNPGALEIGREAVRELHSRKIRILAGTDASNPGTAHGLSMHGELALLGGAGLSPLEALRAATSAPAEVFGLSDRGRVIKGKRADLLLVDGDATADVTATRNILSVWKGGRELVRVEASEAPSAVASSFKGGLVSDFEAGLASAFGPAWQVSTDKMMGGSSAGEIRTARSNERSSQVMVFRGSIQPGSAYPWSGAILLLDNRPMTPVDLRPLQELAFQLKSAAPVTVMVFSKGRGRIPVSRQVDGASAWSDVSVRFADLGLDASDIQAILISGTGGSFEFEIDDVMMR